MHEVRDLRHSRRMPFASLLPLLVYFLLGIALRSSGVLRSDHAGVLLRLVFQVTLPALAFLSVSQAPLGRSSLLLPLIGFSINLLCLGGAWLYATASGSDPRKAGTIIIGASIANMIFIFPVVLASLGQDALAEAILFDLGNAVFVASVANSVAIKLGQSKHVRIDEAALRLLRTPLFLALLLAIALNLNGLRLPLLLVDTLSPLGSATTPLTIVALGLAFKPEKLLARTSVQAVLARMLVGFLLALVIVRTLGLSGQTATVVIVSGAAPIGFNAVTLATVASLKTDEVAAAVSLSVLIGMIVTTLLLWYAQSM